MSNFYHEFIDTEIANFEKYFMDKFEYKELQKNTITTIDSYGLGYTVLFMLLHIRKLSKPPETFYKRMYDLSRSMMNSFSKDRWLIDKALDTFEKIIELL
jgi:hypothetical protein